MPIEVKVGPPPGRGSARLVSEGILRPELASRLFSTGLVGVVNAFNPCLLILGGGVIDGLPELVEVVQQTVQERALAAAVGGLCVMRSALGGQAGVIGAAALARDRQSK